MPANMQKDMFYAVTDDGWSLAVHHYQPQSISKNYPILMVHGLAGNRLHFDLDDRYSLAQAAVARGFDVYVVELRGAGLSIPPHEFGQWGFADYAKHDLPLLITTILERSGAKSLHGIGHSMGGMLLYSAAVHALSELRSIVTIATPLIGQLHLGKRERRLLSIARRVSPAANWAPAAQAYIPLKRLLEAAGNFIHLSTRFVDGMLLNSANCEPRILARMAKEGISDVPLKLLIEITTHMSEGLSQTEPYDYEASLADIHIPVLALAGSVDRVAPAASVQAAVRALVACVVSYREFLNYGHVDLLLGSAAPDEIYPYVLHFVEGHDSTAHIPM